MSTLRHLLGASARLDLLRALYYQHGPVGLRQVARLADVHPHSAERMLKELTREGLVIREKKRTRVLFVRNTSHPDWVVLSDLFEAADRALRDRWRDEVNRRAGMILPFIEEAGGMLKRARRTVRVD